MSSGMFVYNKSGNVSIEDALLVSYLHDLGYRKFSRFKDDKDQVLCIENGSRLVEADVSEMWRRIRMEASNIKESSCVYKAQRGSFKNILSNLVKVNGDPYKDTANTCKLFFNNVVLTVHKNGEITTEEWSENVLGGKKIWEANVNQQNLDLDTFKNFKEGHFYQFAKNIAGEEGVEYLMRALGYLIHTFKSEVFCPAVIFSDSCEGDDGANGRTGKSLLVTKALQKMRPISVLDGKRFNSKSSFAFQLVDDRNPVVAIEDVSSSFDYTSLYNAISGNMETEKKGMSSVTIDFKKSPKITMSTNYGVNIGGDSDRGRLLIIGLQKFYGVKHKPVDDFGVPFFDDGWVGKHEIQWQYFFGFMIECVRLYFEKGAVSFNSEKMEAAGKARYAGGDMMEYVLNNYKDYVGPVNAKCNAEISQTLKVYSTKNQKPWKSLKTAMESIGFKRIEHKFITYYSYNGNSIFYEPDNTVGYSKVRSKSYYYELVDQHMFDSIVGSYESNVEEEPVKETKKVVNGKLF